jgi:hypothetical protein
MKKKIDGSQQRNFFYGFEGIFWICFMHEDEIPGATAHFLWVCFDGKILGNNILYNILYGVQRMNEEQGSLFQQKYMMVTARIEP